MNLSSGAVTAPGKPLRGAPTGRGESRRRPIAEQLREQVVARLEEELGPQWPQHCDPTPFNQPTACALALGLSA